MGRRGFLIGAGALAMSATTILPSEALAARRGGTRRLAFHNLHSGEKIDLVYFDKGRYLPDALEALNVHMRDPWNDDIARMHPKLFDLLHALHQRTGSTRPFELISGYRSPATNAVLAARSSGVAKRSYHLRGWAADIRLPGYDLRALHKAALSIRRGGVGLYTRSNFVHVDVGPRRRWGH